LSENTVVYKLFPTVNAGNNNCSSNLPTLEKIAENYISRLSGFLNRYIWQNDCFNLHVVEESLVSSAHLKGVTCFEDNIEDEWFIVYLLFYLTEKYQDLVVQIQDNDGEFLLIEAAEYV
ncbi:Protein SGT1, partial [Stegodyphus mimosarum]